MSTSAKLTFSVASPDTDTFKTQALVVGVYSTVTGPQLVRGALPQETIRELEENLESLGVSGSADQLHRFPGLHTLGADIIALIGLGEKPDSESERHKALRYAAGSAIRQLAGFKDIAIAFDTSSESSLSAVAEGAALGAFTDSRFKAKATNSTKPAVEKVTFITGVSPDLAAEPLNRALVLGEAVASTRRLVNTPPNYLYPQTFAEQVQVLTADLADVEVEIFDETQLQIQGFGGIAGVGQGSVHPPQLVTIRYSPRQAQANIALVGKGITFDSGGNSLKPAASMMTMKSDMAGAATVLNALVAAAQLKLPVAVTAYLCLAENMPGGSALRPEDVITLRNGQTVEVLNTDAEGRLVMADGLAYASEFKPDAVIDVATLTGAQMVALGTRYAAVMGDTHIRKRLLKAATVAGEDFWAMPLPGYLRAELKSPVADLKNIGSTRWGGMLTAGLFLQEFVGEVNGQKIPWAHLDIAGPSFNEGAAYGFTPQEGTGMSVATLLAFLESYIGEDQPQQNTF